MGKLIVLNAPPRAGKDTIARDLQSEYMVSTASFKAPMFNIVRAMIGVANFAEFMRIYESDKKDSARPDFMAGMTCREFMIWVSEVVIKPKFGKRYFGELMAEFLKCFFEEGETVVCTDGGFPDEIEALIDAGIEINLVRLHREGFDFSNDSRDYIYLSEEYASKPGVEQVDLHMVHGDPEFTSDQIATLFIK